MNESVHTGGAPAAIGPYSQAIRSTGGNRMLFCSGQIPLIPQTGEMVPGGVDAQARQALSNLRAVVEAGGFALGDVAKTTIYLVSMADFPKVNEVYSSFFGAPLPARATVAVAGLPLGARVEVDAVCVAE
jgi:2-iminobutanoate/2-iminopropanoate deaminase